MADYDEEGQDKIEKSNAKYNPAANKHRRKQLVVVGDQVMVFLRHERFPMGTYSKPESRKYRPYQIVKKINQNAYVVPLSYSMGILKTFNVENIFPYYSSEEPMYPNIPTNSRSSFSQVGETDAEHMVVEYMEHWDQNGS